MQKRRKKFLYPEVQIRVVLISLGVASLVLMINFLLTMSTLSKISVEAARGLPGNILVEEFHTSIVRMFLISVGFCFPVAAIFGVFFSFRFAGPLYNFRKYFGELKSGRWGNICHLRTGDDLQDLATVINEALEQMRSSVRDSHQALQGLHAQLEVAAQSEQAAGIEQIEQARDKAMEIQSTLEASFPFLVAKASPAAAKLEPAPAELQA